MAEILGHRGASNLAPQNTMAAFKKGVELGVDGFETDVHLTKDGEIVICHNYDICETSDGEGLIADMTLEELRKYDFGSYFSEEFKGERIPTLDEFLEVSKGLKTVNLEIKEPAEKNDLVQKTIDRVRAFKMEKQVIMSSFSIELMEESKKIAPEIKTGFLYDMRSPLFHELSADPVAFCKKHNLDALHPLVFLVDEEFVGKCRDAGIDVNVWTVNDKEGIELLNEMGVNAVMTDVPELCL